MPDILPQDAVISPQSPSAEPPVVKQMPKAVETTEPVENIYSIEDYDHVFKNKEMFSDDEYSDIKKSFSTHSFNSKDAQYAVDNMNLGVTINETLKSRIPKIKESEVMKDLTLNPSGIDKFMPPLERAEYRKNKFTKDVYDESNLKHINALHYSKTLNIPIDEVYADYSNVQQQYHGAGFGFVIDDTTAFNQIKEIYHPDSLTLGEAVSVGYSRMKANWNRASDREDLNERAYGSIFAGDDITSFIDERKKQQSINRIPASGDNAFTNSFYEAVGMGSQFVGSWIEGAKGAAIGGAGGLALGAVTGPGAVATGLAGAGKGFSVGSFKYWTEQGTSSMMMDMVESGISQDLARKIALPMGLVYAGIEKIGALDKIPGMRGGGDKTAVRGIVQKLKAKAIKYIIEVSKESSEEGLQEGIAQFAQRIGYELSPEEAKEKITNIPTLISAGEAMVKETMDAAPAIMWFGAGHGLGDNTYEKPETQAEHDIRQSIHKKGVKQQIKEIEDDIAQNITVTKDGVEVKDEALETKSLIHKWLNKNKELTEEEFQKELKPLVQSLGLSQVTQMNRVELFEELGMEKKQFITDNSLREMVQENRSKLILPEGASKRLNEYIVRTSEVKDLVLQEEVEDKFKEQLEIIDDKLAEGEQLTKQEEELIVIDSEENLGGGKYTEALTSRLNKAISDEVIEGITETPEQAQELSENYEQSPMVRQFVDYLAATTGRSFIMTGKEHTLSTLVQDEVLTEEQAIQRAIESGQFGEGEVDVKALERAVVKGYNDGVTSYIAKTGDITTVLEENAEAYYKEAVRNNFTFSNMVGNNRRAWEKATGEKSTQSDIEWFSDRAVDYALEDNQLWEGADMEIKSVFESLAELAKMVMERAATTLNMLMEGTLSESFEKSLREATMPFIAEVETEAPSFQIEVKEAIKSPSEYELEEENWTDNENKLREDVKEDERKFKDKGKAMSYARLKRVSDLNQKLKDLREDVIAKSQELERYAAKWLTKAEYTPVLKGLRDLRKVSPNAIKWDAEAVFSKALDGINKTIDSKEVRELKVKFEKTLKKVPKSRGKKPKGMTDADLSAEITKIRDIAEMTPEALDKATQSNLKIDTFKEGDDAEQAVKEADENLARISAFGSYKDMDAAALNKAIESIERLISEGKARYLIKEKGKKEQVQSLINSFTLDVTDGRGVITNQAERQQYMKGNEMRQKQVAEKTLLNIQTVATLSDILSNKRTENMLEGEITKYITTKMQIMDNTYNRNLRETYKEVQEKYKKYFGSDETTLEYLDEVKENTGIFIKGSELSISYSDAVTLYMQWGNKKGKNALINAGFKNDTIEQLTEFMDLSTEQLPNKSSLIAYSRELLEFYNNYYDRVNDTYRKVYNIDLPREENYSPLSIFTQGDIDNMKMLQEGGARASLLSTAMMSRTNHKKEAKLTGVSAFNTLTQHITSMENFIAKAEGMKEIRSVMQSQDMKLAIEQEVGGAVNRALSDSFDRYEVGMLSSTYKINTLDRLLSNYTKSKLALKVGNVTKQASSAIAYMVSMPVNDYVRGMTNFVSNPQLMQERVSELMQSEFMKERYSKGIDSAMRTALSTATERHTLINAPFSERLADYMMIFTKAGDAAAILSGGWALYDYKTKEYLASGLSEADAKSKALVDFENITALMQQSGKSKDVGAWQESGNSLIRLFTMFQNSQFAYWRVMQAGYRNLRKGRGSKAQNLKALAMAGIILPATFASMSLANKATWALMTGNLDNPDDEESMRRALLGIFTGPFSSIPLPLIGDSAESIATSIAGNHAPWMGQLPLIGEVYRLGRFTQSVFSGEFLDAMKEAASIAGTMKGLPFDTVWKGAQEVLVASDVINEE